MADTFVPLVVKHVTSGVERVVTDVAAHTQARYDGYEDVREASLKVIETVTDPETAQAVKEQRAAEKAQKNDGAGS